MRLNTIIFVFLIFLGAFWGFSVSANATPGAPESAQGQKEIAHGVPSNQAQKIVLSPFFRLQKRDSKVWIERILVTFLMARPLDCLKYDLNNPAFRKAIDDLLQSEEPGRAIESQAMNALNRQLGMNVDATVQISRSVIIVR
jgi:hypothetical protein